MHIYSNLTNRKWPGNRNCKNYAPLSQSHDLKLDKDLPHLLSSNLVGIRFVGSQAVQGK